MNRTGPRGRGDDRPAAEGPAADHRPTERGGPPTRRPGYTSPGQPASAADRRRSAQLQLGIRPRSGQLGDRLFSRRVVSQAQDLDLDLGDLALRHWAMAAGQFSTRPAIALGLGPRARAQVHHGAGGARPAGRSEFFLVGQFPLAQKRQLPLGPRPAGRGSPRSGRWNCIRAAGSAVRAGWRTDSARALEQRCWPSISSATTGLSTSSRQRNRR